MTNLEVWIKRHEGTPGAINKAAQLFGVTPAEARAAYDRVYRVPLGAVPEIKKEVENLKENSSTASTRTERATLYAALRNKGAEADEAAKAAGWKNFKNMQSALIPHGIRVSTKEPFLLPPDAPRRASLKTDAAAEEPPKPRKPTVNAEFEAAFAPKLDKPEPKPVPVTELIPAQMELMEEPPKPSSLRPCAWYGKVCSYTDNGDYIEIKPIDGLDFRMIPDTLKQFSEELRELLEIIK